MEIATLAKNFTNDRKLPLREKNMLNKKLIEQEYGFLKGVVFLNVSSVVMPPLSVQKAYGNFMANYVIC